MLDDGAPFVSPLPLLTTSPIAPTDESHGAGPWWTIDPFTEPSGRHFQGTRPVLVMSLNHFVVALTMLPRLTTSRNLTTSSSLTSS